MREDPTETANIRFPFAVIAVTEQVGVPVVQQLPLGTRELLRGLRRIERAYPVRVLLEVIGAGDEPTTGFREPVSRAGMSGHRDGTTVFHRDADNFRMSTGIAAELVGKGRDQHRSRGAAVAARRALRRVDLGICIDGGTLGQQAVVCILDIVGREAGLAVKP